MKLLVENRFGDEAEAVSVEDHFFSSGGLFEFRLKAGDVIGHPEAGTMKVVNFVSIGVLAATYLLGVLDGNGHYNDLPDERRASLDPAGLTLRF